MRSINSNRACLVAGALTLFAVPAMVGAQDSGSKPQDAVMSRRVTLTLENADIRYGLKLLFNSVGANFTLDPLVQGTVTVSLTDVPFRTALESLLRSTNSTGRLSYRLEDGVYHIGPKAEDAGPADVRSEEIAPTEPQRRIAKIQVNFVDARLLAAQLGGSIISLGDRSLLLRQGFGNGFGNGAFGGNQGGFGGFGGGFGNNSGFNNGFGGFGNRGQGFGGNGFNSGFGFGGNFRGGGGPNRGGGGGTPGR